MQRPMQKYPTCGKKKDRTELLGVEVAVTAMKEAYRENCWDSRLKQVRGCDNKILLCLFESSCIQDSWTLFENEQDWPKKPSKTFQLHGGKLENFKPLAFC